MKVVTEIVVEVNNKVFVKVSVVRVRLEVVVAVLEEVVVVEAAIYTNKATFCKTFERSVKNFYHVDELRVESYFVTSRILGLLLSTL